MSLARKIFINAASNYVRYAIAVVVAFFLSPFVVHSLGNAAYGVWVLVGSMIGYMGLLDFGMRPTIVKFVSKYKAAGDSRKINEVLNTILVVYCIPGVLVLVATPVVAMISEHLFKVPAELVPEMKTTIMIVGVSVALSFPFGLFNGVLNAFQRFDLNNTISIVVILLRSAIIVVLLKSGLGIVALAGVSLTANVIEFVGKYIWCRKIFPDMKVAPKLASKEMFGRLRGFSVYAFLIAISVQVSFYTDSLVIGSMISASAVTYFAIGANLISYLKSLVSNFSTVITPVASTFDEKGEHARMQELLVVGSRYLFGLVLPICAAFLVVGKTFIFHWMGEEYAGPSSEVLIILSIGYLGFLTQFVSGSIFSGLGRIKYIAFLHIGQAVVNLGLSLILVGPLGLNGVAIGTAVPLFLYGTLIVPVYMCRTLKLSIFAYLRRSYVAPLICAIPYLTCLLYINASINISSLFEFFAWMLIPAAVYAISFFFIGLMEEHRISIRKVLFRT